MDAREQRQDRISILCVEDDGLTREFLRRLVELNYASCKVLTAENGLAGLEAFQAHGVDIVLTDLNMPVMDGIQLAREIRGARQGACIIALTAYDISDCLAGEERHSLFDHYLLKPVDRKQLCDTIDLCISGMT